MDDATLGSLKAALAASPDNAELLCVVLRAHLSRDEADQAAALLEGSSAALQTPEACATAAWVWLRVGQPARVPPLTQAATPELLLLRVRALLALQRREEASAAYHEALAQNSTVQDADIEAQLRSRCREVEPRVAGQPQLRVISNDDTTSDEVSRLLAPAQEVVRFADVGGLDAVKKQIHKKLILPFQKPSLFERFRKRAGGGILLYGPPGCGKTLLARATAGECDAQFFSVSISDILDMYIGESSQAPLRRAARSAHGAHPRPRLGLVSRGPGPGPDRQPQAAPGRSTPGAGPRPGARVGPALPRLGRALPPARSPERARVADRARAAARARGAGGDRGGRHARARVRPRRAGGGAGTGSARARA